MAEFSDINNHVTSLLNVGADAMANMYDVYIEFPASLAQITETEKLAFSVRAKDITLPSPKQQTYEVGYKTVKIKRPATQIVFDRTIEIPFRLDAYYDVYRYLSLWRNRTMTPSSGYATNELYPNQVGTFPNNNLGRIKVVALAEPVHMNGTLIDASYSAKGVSAGLIDPNETNPSAVPDIADDQVFSFVWTFEDVWIEELSEPAFKKEGAEALEVKAKFNFGRYKDPFANQFEYFTNTNGSDDLQSHIEQRGLAGLNPNS